ncbi:MAG: Ig-like domain-containing protein [Gemmatimonadaceae bacterium]|nr:Ig-like domain-containing protein [Gemmatimonadaceae bacterium]
MQPPGVATIAAPTIAAPTIAAPTIAAPTIAAPTIAAPTIAAPTTPRTVDRTDVRVRAALASASRGSALQIAPLVSHSLRMGERVRLRWSLRPPSGRRAPQRVDFTSADATIASVDSRTGLVTARAPGRARIIVDAGAAGMKVVTLEVRLPAAFPLVTIPPLVGIDAASATAIMSRVSTRLQWEASPELAQAPESRSARSGVLRRDSASARAATGVAVPSAAALRSAAPGASSAADAPRGTLPNSTDMRTAAVQLAGIMQIGGVRNADVLQFLDDGAEHRVTLASTPVITSFSAYSVRISFDLRLTKYVSSGRSVTRLIPVTMDVDKRDRVLKSSAVVIGAMRRP